MRSDNIISRGVPVHRMLTIRSATRGPSAMTGTCGTAPLYHNKKNRHPTPRPGLWRNIARYVGMCMCVCLCTLQQCMWRCAETVLRLTYNRDVIITQIPVSGSSTVRDAPTPTTTAHTCYAAPSCRLKRYGAEPLRQSPPRHISDRYDALLVPYRYIKK